MELQLQQEYEDWMNMQKLLCLKNPDTYPIETYNFSGGFRFYDAVVNDRALIERSYVCGMDY